MTTTGPQHFLYQGHAARHLKGRIASGADAPSEMVFNLRVLVDFVTLAAYR
jgi:hypothetical protein